MLVLQNDLLSTYGTRIVAPLAVPKAFKMAERLNPAFEVEARKVHLLPADLAVVPVSILVKPIGNLVHARDAIIAALDLVFTGI